MKKIGVILLVVFLSIIPVKIIKADSGTVDKAILEILKEKQMICSIQTKLATIRI